MDVARSIHWSLGCLDRAIDGAKAVLGTLFAKEEFWKQVWHFDQ
jgi:hypothetical protein